ncbi:MAG: ABC transporter permease [Halanaerobiales bacterium]
MDIFKIAYYEFIRKARNKRFLAMLILFPILLIFILGYSLDSIFDPEFYELDLKVGFIDDGSNVMEKFEQYLKRDEYREFVSVIRFENEEIAQSSLENADIKILFEYNQKLSAEVISDDRGLYGEQSIFLSRIILSDFQSYINIDRITTNGAENINRDRHNFLKEKSLSPLLNIPDAVDYYSIVTILQFLLIGTFLGYDLKIRNKESDLEIRLRSLPFRRWRITVGMIIGNILLLFATSLIVVLFSYYVYRANWNGNWLIISVTLLLFSAVSVGIGLLLGSLTNNTVRGYSFLFIIVILYIT